MKPWRLLSIAAAIFLFDRFSKWLIVEAWNLRDLLRIDVWPGFVTFKMAWNRGINFGLMAGDSAEQPLILAGLAVAIAAAVAVWAVRRGDAWSGWGAAALVGGALGNAWDRLYYAEAAVADFLNVSCCGVVNPYAFNVADVAIFAGAAALVLAPQPERGAA